MNILLIDDDHVSSFIINVSLQKKGVPLEEIHIASGGQKALEIINDWYTTADIVPDIILVDLNMPEMSGFEFIEAFNKLSNAQTSRTRIIVVTTSNNDRDKRRAIDLGVTHFITKPVSPAAISEILMQTISN